MATVPKTLFELTNSTTISLGTDRLVIFGSGYEKDILVSDFIAQIGVSPVAVSSVSTTQTLTTAGRYFKADASSGSITLTLPAASGNSGYKATIKKMDSTSNAVVIDGNGSETIDGQLTQSITNQWNSMDIVCDGSNWIIV